MLRILLLLQLMALSPFSVYTSPRTFISLSLLLKQVASCARLIYIWLSCFRLCVIGSQTVFSLLHSTTVPSSKGGGSGYEASEAAMITGIIHVSAYSVCEGRPELSALEQSKSDRYHLHDILA